MSGPHIGAVVLAAGQAARFGAIKQLARLDGRPLLEHALDTLHNVPAIAQTVVVLGEHAEAIRAGTNLGDARAVVCADWAGGPTRSLLAGLDALGDVDALLVLLGDQPRISPQVIAMVLDEGLIARPAATRALYAGAPGHPVLIRQKLFDALRASGGPHGARDLLAAAGVHGIEAGHICDPADIDTQADMEALTR